MKPHGNFNNLFAQSPLLCCNIDGSGCFIYVFHDFFVGDGFDLDLKAWGTTRYVAFFCVKNTILVVYTFLNHEDIFSVRSMWHLNLRARHHLVWVWHQIPWPFAEEERSWPWKMCAIISGPFLAFPRFFFYLLTVFFCLFLRRDVNLFVRKAKQSKFLPCSLESLVFVMDMVE